MKIQNLDFVKKCFPAVLGVVSKARNTQAKQSGLLNYAVAGDVVGTKENTQMCISDNMRTVSELHAM